MRGRPSGTWIGSQYAWVAPSEWVEIDWGAHSERDGAASLIASWLERFGPGTLDDIVWWTGATKGLVRTALADVGAVIVELDDGTDGFVLPGDDRPTAPDAAPWVALLPGLDPTAMGWKRREWYLAPDIATRVRDRNGNIGPTVWADGRIVGGWSQRADGSIAHDAEALTPAQLELLDVEIDRLRGVVGETRFTARFPSPNQRDLRT